MHPSSSTQPHRWGAWPSEGNREGNLWQFNLWAPSAMEIALHLGERRIAMEKNADGWFTALEPATAGDLYGYERDGEGEVHPDPASKLQEGDVFSRSRLVDPATLKPAGDWRGRPWEEAVILEIHVGTFTEAGTLAAAAQELPRLAALGITAVELMPLNQFPGNRGWGYDGVLTHALHPAYGTPQDLTAFIAEAHAQGIMVLVDVVYNHFGPEGNVLATLCPEVFDSARQTPWGAAIDIDNPVVAQFFIQGAELWVRDYGADGLRLDAVHEIGQPGTTEFVETLATHVRGLDAGRITHVVTEDERNLARYTGPGRPVEAQWNDDYHHCIHVLLTGETESYYKPYSVDPMSDLSVVMAEGQVEQGQPRQFREKPLGEPSGDLPPTAFVNANQNHDQIGNRALGDRLITLTTPAAARAAHALLLLSPFVPMMFMGEEEGSRAPFLFFCDFNGFLADAVRKGRRREFPEFDSHPGDLPDPNEVSTFEASRPYAEPAPDAEDWRGLTGRLLSLRRTHVVPLVKSGWRGSKAELLSDRTLRAAWHFEQGTLEIFFSLEGNLPAFANGTQEIFAMDDASGAGLRCGLGGVA